MASAVPPARVARARLGVFVLFVGLGVSLGTQVSRTPSVRDLLNVTPSQLALLFIIGFSGGLVSAVLIGWVVARLGSRVLFLASCSGMAVGIWGAGFATVLGSPAVFAASAWVTSFFWAFVDAAANTEAATVERLMGRSVMSQFHASFSIGMAGGLGLGILASHAELPVVWHLGASATLVLAVYLPSIRLAVIDGAPTARPGDAPFGPFTHAREALRERRTLAIGVVMFFAFLAEMAASDWVPLSVVDDFGKTEAVGDAFYAAFVVAATAVRIVGHRFIDMWGRIAVVRASTVCMAAGAVLFAFTPVIALAPVALLVWGVGASLGYPLCVSAAADDPQRAPARVGAVTAFATVAGLTMPQVIGFGAEAFTLRKALLVVVAGAAVMFALAGALRPLRPGAQGNADIVVPTDTLGA